MNELQLFVFHLIGIITFGFGCYYDWNYVIVPKEATNMFGNFGWKLKFLTYWDAVRYKLKTKAFTMF